MCIIKLVKWLLRQSVPWQPVGIGRIIYTYTMCGILSGNRGRKGRSEPGQKRNRDKEATVAGNLLARVQVTVAIALKRSVHTTRVRCMYDPAIQPPPRAPLIYIGSDLPILCITRAWIVISLWPSEVQSSGMAVASLCLVPRPPIYRFIRCTRSIPRMETGEEIHDPYSHGIWSRGSSTRILLSFHFRLDCFFHGSDNIVQPRIFLSRRGAKWGDLRRLLWFVQRRCNSFRCLLIFRIQSIIAVADSEWWEATCEREAWRFSFSFSFFGIGNWSELVWSEQLRWKMKFLRSISLWICLPGNLIENNS